MLNPVKVLETLLSVSPGFAKVILGALSIVIVAAFIYQLKIDQNDLPFTLLFVAFSYVILVILTNLDGLLGKVISYFFVFTFLSYFTIFIVQTISFNALPFMHAGCYWNMFQTGCPASSDVVLSSGTPVPAGPEPTAGDQPAAPPGKVYVHFAGSIAREAINDAIAGTQGNWKIFEAERLSSSYGLNEVRYFNPSDHEAAVQVATMFSELAAWTDTLAVVDLSARYPEVPDGQLEIWTSAR